MRNSLQLYYSTLREKNRRLSDKRFAECEEKNPRFASLRTERGQVVIALAAGKLTHEQAQSRIAAISAERKNLLISLGLPADYLDPIYTCQRCRDTGEVGGLVKKPCACQLRQLQKELKDGARVNERETFEAFDPSIYPDDEQRRYAIRLKNYCVRYVEALPKPEKQNLLLFGNPGTGKSFIGNAIAAAAIDRCIETRKVTAYRFVQDALDGIQSNTETMALYTNVPLLVLDDLGTEAMIPNVTGENLFRVLNERAALRLPTVLITNLPPESLTERYGERITSRMTDKAITALIPFKGSNLRVR